MVKRTERGWAGHFICADKCLFRRNTLLEYGNKRIVVSTVGGYRFNSKIDTIGSAGKYYETMAFEAKKEGPYWEADVNFKVSFKSEWSICAKNANSLPNDVDNKANDMHEKVVKELSKFISKPHAKVVF